jgi:hypothetical protein
MWPKVFRKIAVRSFAFRAVAVLLLGMTAASAMNAADMALPAGILSERPSADPALQPVRLAGCHGHESPASLPLPIVPATVPPAPRSYQCCVAGHHAVIPFASFSLRLVLARLGDASSAGRFPLGTAEHSSSIALISPFGSPPGGFSLRI